MSVWHEHVQRHAVVGAITVGHRHHARHTSGPGYERTACVAEAWQGLP